MKAEFHPAASEEIVEPPLDAGGRATHGAVAEDAKAEARVLSKSLNRTNMRKVDKVLITGGAGFIGSAAAVDHVAKLRDNSTLVLAKE
jgi:molybdopterin biosynthesis enzyme MoaB